MSIDKRMPPLLPEDVVELLKLVDESIGMPRVAFAIKPEQLRELVLVWLRVAALYEHATLPEAERMAAALLFGATVPVPDTEPHNEKPDGPAFMCSCGLGFTGTTICPRCGEYVQ